MVLIAYFPAMPWQLAPPETMSPPLRRLSAVPEPSELSERAIEHSWIQGITLGDERAFEAMFRRYNRELHRFALHLLRSPDEAEDVVQAVFVAIWQNRASWTIRSGLRVYLFTAVRNRALQQFRNARVRRGLEPDVFALSAAPPSEPFLSPDVQVDQADFTAALAKAVAALPPRCREAFVLTREHGMTYAEAAATMGISPHTIMVQIGRALASLRKSLAPFLVTLLLVR
jgi:RNA polymerase sigma-70 factor, ECF subfamily